MTPCLLTQVAIKFLERGAGVNKSVLREILNHRLCVVHPNIVQFREIFLTPVHLAIVMEFAAGGDMFEYVIKQKMPQHGQGLVENSARAFFQQLIIALDFCHELGIANRCLTAASACAALTGLDLQSNPNICTRPVPPKAASSCAWPVA